MSKKAVKKTKKTRNKKAHLVTKGRSRLEASPDRSLLSKGRQSVSSYADTLFNIFRARRYQDHHRYDLTQYANKTSSQLLDILIDSNPDVSQALFSFLRMCNSGHTFQVVDQDGKAFKEGQKVMDSWVKELELEQTNKGFKEDRSLNSLINKTHLSFFTKGAASGEVVLTERFKPNYLVAVDPDTIWFKQNQDQYSKGELIPWQIQPFGTDRKMGTWEGSYKRLDIPSFFYQPLDPRLDDVYGVCPILPVLQIIFFQLQILQDLQAVVHKAGYPRISIKVLEETLIKNAPPTIKHDAKALSTWLSAQKTALENEYKEINPEDAIIHYDSVDIKYLETNKGMGSYDARALIEIIDSQLIASLKSLSTLMGRHKGRTETYASAEVQLYIKGVEAIQAVSSLYLSRQLTFCLNMFGLQGYVIFKYLPIELRSKTELAQWDSIRIKNNLVLVALKMKSFDECAIELTGHAPVGEAPENDLILALLGVQYPQYERPSSSSNNNDNRGRQQFRTVDELLAVINGN